MIKKLLVIFSLIFFVPFIVNAEELKLESIHQHEGNTLATDFNTLYYENGDYIVSFYAVGNTLDELILNGDRDAILYKYNKDGNLLWKTNWGGSNIDLFYSAITIDDGGLIAVGQTRSIDVKDLVSNGSDDGSIVRYDKDGNIVWQKSWGGSDSDYFRKIVKTSDNNYIIFGTTSSTDIEGCINNGSADLIILKINLNGDILWKKNFGGSKNEGTIDLFSSNDGGGFIFF